MCDKRNILNKLKTVQSICTTKSYTKIDNYENIIQFINVVDYCATVDQCSTCSGILKEMDKVISIPYNNKDICSWKLTEIIDISNCYIVNTDHLVEEHNYYRKKVYIIWTSVFLVLVDIVSVMLFINDYVVYPIFPISLVFYYLGSYIENWYVNKYIKKFLEF